MLLFQMGKNSLVKSKAQKTMRNNREQNSFPGNNFSLKEGNSQKRMPSTASATQKKNYIENSLICSTKWKWKSTYDIYIKAFKWINTYNWKEIKINRFRTFKFTIED